MGTDLAGLAQQRTQGFGSYGFTEGAVDPTTGLTGIGVFDPNNPFSKAALLKKTYNTNRARAAQTMGSSGQLYSGAFQNQQDLVNRGQLQDEDALQKSLIGFLAENQTARERAQDTYHERVAGAHGERIGRLESGENPLYSPAAPAPAAAPTVSAPNVKAPVVKSPAQQAAAFARSQALARSQAAAAAAKAKTKAKKR